MFQTQIATEKVLSQEEDWKKKGDVGPGQFKLDPYLVSCGALDSVVKEVIHEANFYNSNIPKIIDNYTKRNKIAVLTSRNTGN